MVIPSSELILNPDGSIYHLAVCPGQMAMDIITVGDPDRVDAVTQHFDNIEFTIHRREFKTTTGTYKGKRISVISTGIGTDNIDIVFNEIDALFNIDFATRQIREELQSLNFYRIGTSGSISEKVKVDDFLYSEMAIGFDGLIHYYDLDESPKEKELNLSFKDQFETIQEKYRPYFVEGNQSLAQKFKNDFKSGVTLTANGFYGPQGRHLRLNSSFRTELSDVFNTKLNGFEFTNLEMETAGIYGISRLLNHRAISLNAILANRVTQEFSKQPTHTIQEMIKLSLDLIAKD